jgi:3-oxoadipate enol-lactonase
MVLERTIVINGRDVRYLESGAGQPLVLVHAFPLNADQWRPQLERLPEGWRALAPDLRGFGGPRLDDDQPITMDDYATDVSAFMDALDIDRAVIGGLSMGGYIAFAFVRRFPARMTGLILADTRSTADTAEGVRGRLALLERLRGDGPPAVGRDLIPKLLGPTSLATRRTLEAVVAELIERNDAAGIAAAIHALIGRPDSTPDLKRIRVPALIVVGDEDTITPPSDAEAMHLAIDGSEIAVLPKAGHLSNLETPDEFSAVLADFLRRSFR